MNNTPSNFILVAEDNDISKEVIRWQLDSLGFQCDIVNNGEEALAALEKKEYSLLITDYDMPKIDGYELTKKIRSNGNNMPILMLLISNNSEQIERFLNLGGNDHLTKPSHPNNLKEKLDLFLKEISPDTPPSKIDNNILNFPELLMMFGDKETTLILIDEFFIDHYKSIGELILLTQNKDIKGLGDIAHRMKGASSMITANALSEACGKIELDMRNEELDNIEVLIQSVKEQTSYLKSHLTAYQ